MTRSRLIPAGLILLSVVPVVAGGFRVTQLASGGEVTPDNARFFAMPIPVLLHIFGASVFCVLGALQFDAVLRRRHPRWHRAAGRVVLPCGLIAALSGMWMAVFYDLPATDVGVLTGLRLFFGGGMAAALVAAFVAIRRGEVARHRAWMMRGYAIGIGAGTQLFTLGPLLLLDGVPQTAGRAIGHAAGWLINLAVAEWFIRRKPHVRGANRMVAAQA